MISQFFKRRLEPPLFIMFDDAFYIFSAKGHRCLLILKIKVAAQLSPDYMAGASSVWPDDKVDGDYKGFASHGRLASSNIIIGDGERETLPFA